MLYVLSAGAFMVNGIRLGTCVVMIIGYTQNGITKPIGSLDDTAERIERWNAIGIGMFHSIIFLATVWRITWISREARHDPQARLRYKKLPFFYDANFKGIVLSIVDSGIFFSLGPIAAVVLPIKIHLPFDGQIPFDFSVFTTLLTGVAPTLLIVRVEYARDSWDVEADSLVSIHFVENPNDPSIPSPPNDENDEPPALESQEKAPDHRSFDSSISNPLLDARAVPAGV
ncbi:hypothetical protein PQX77_020240 [Marasmius sp. AFHP31]|nr:hypothetical protein PQX77_020240 [Marasmius sp. AFHP31]